MENIENLLNESNNNLLFSDEFISKLNSKQLRSLSTYFKKRDYVIKFILFIRNPLFLLASRFQQSAPVRCYEDNINRIDLHKDKKLLSNIKKIFGNSCFYSYDACKQDIAGYFYSKILNIPAINKAITINDDNRSICSESFDILKFFNSTVNKKYLDNRTNLDLLNYYNQFSILKKIPGPTFYPTKKDYALIKSIAIPYVTIFNNIIGKKFFTENVSLLTKEVAWNIEQLQYIKNKMHLFYDHNKPKLNYYFQNTSFKSNRCELFFKREIQPFILKKQNKSYVRLLYDCIHFIKLHESSNKIYYFISFIISLMEKFRRNS